MLETTQFTVEQILVETTKGRCELGKVAREHDLGSVEVIKASQSDVQRKKLEEIVSSQFSRMTCLACMLWGLQTIYNP